MIAQRIVTAETLDHLAPSDPAALRSRRDLVRVHRAMATRSILLQAWTELMHSCQSKPLRILEIGAGDGTLLLGVARALPASPTSQPKGPKTSFSA
jgi:SAM-dependent MidA family methyltransferase